MKLVTFSRSSDGAPAVGAVVDDRVYAATDASLDMITLIRGWAERQKTAESWIRDNDPIPIEEVRLLAPILRPGKILCMGMNYVSHVEENRAALPTEQIWFCKQPTAAHGPLEPIWLPRRAKLIDYEVELVAVIGTRAKHVIKERAAEIVFGYAVGNDVSARDWQRKTPQWMLGKSFDTHGPFGPWITTKDEIPDPHALDITCKVNGEIRQSSNTQHMIFNLWDQIAELSQVMTLEPGDIIYSGTPSGIGAAMKPPSFLKEGDIVTCEVSRLGKIEAKMVPEPQQDAELSAK